MTAEAAALCPTVMELRTRSMLEVIRDSKQLRGQKNPEKRSNEINSALCPDAAWHCGRDGARGIDAHAEERRFEGYAKRVETGQRRSSFNAQA